MLAWTAHTRLVGARYPHNELPTCDACGLFYEETERLAGVTDQR